VKSKPVVPRDQANRDIDQAVAWYLQEQAPQAALGLIDALEAAYAAISRSPSAGSPRYGNELKLPGIRSWQLSGYPFLVFYVERIDHIDVWRVLHAQRDIPAWMKDPDE